MAGLSSIVLLSRLLPLYSILGPSLTRIADYYKGTKNIPRGRGITTTTQTNGISRASSLYPYFTQTQSKPLSTPGVAHCGFFLTLSRRNHNRFYSRGTGGKAGQPEPGFTELHSLTSSIAPTNTRSDTGLSGTIEDMSGHSSHEAKSASLSESETHSHSHELHAESHDLNSHSHESHSHSHSHDHEHSHGLLHSHSHGHNDLLGKGFTTNPAVRITWIGLIVNVLMSGSKAMGAVYFHSQALMADAIHSFSDMIADFLTLATVNVASKEGSFAKFPLGYGKIESVGTLMVSGVLLFAGFTVGWLSLLQIFEYILPTLWFDYVLTLQVHSHTHAYDLDTLQSVDGHSHIEHDAKQIPNINAAWLALASIGVKELLFRKTMQVAKGTNSKVLVANAWHHRVDSLTAAVAFVTITAGYLFGAVWLDAVGGALVSVLIMNAGFGTFRDAWYELIDRGAPKDSETYGKIRLLVEEAVDDAEELTNTKCEVVDVSVLSAGARTNIMVKLGTSEDILLLKMQKLELELISGLREKDKYMGRVFVEYELKKEHQ